MKFDHTIAITGGQADTVDPRSAPQSVLERYIKQTPPTLPNTDQSPTVTALTLEGTASQTVTVQAYALDDTAVQDAAKQADNPRAVEAARRFYAVGATQVVTVGEISYVRSVPGSVYYRLTSAPAADAVLKIGFAAGCLPYPEAA